jgi:hypothetical protein
MEALNCKVGGPEAPDFARSRRNGLPNGLPYEQVPDGPPSSQSSA